MTESPITETPPVAAWTAAEAKRPVPAGEPRVSERVPIILDVDTGTDDALALAYAVASPRIDLVAVTTVAGNVDVEKATANTLAVLDWLAASDIPVHRGASRPLVRPHRDASYFHDEGGLGGAQLPRSTRSVGADRGPAAIIRLARQRPGELTLVALGPLTNLAIALNVEPELPELLKSVVVMGGAFTVPGNTTPAAEFNIFVDPEAAEQVFSRAVFEPHRRRARRHRAGRAHSRRLGRRQCCSILFLPRRVCCVRLAGLHFPSWVETSSRFHDPLSVAVAIDPTLVDIQ